MYEHWKQPLISGVEFAWRVVRHLIYALAAIGVSLGIGIVGYHYLDGLPWIDALVNASMILGGMGPVDPLKNGASKLFASFYALFSGLVFIALLGFLLAPFFHRLIHRFHLENEGGDT
jgi:hypothetical protein